MSSTTTKKPGQTSLVDFHKGATLGRISDTYPHLTRTLVEMVQNSVDGGATSVFIGIDVEARRAIIADNGDGVGAAKFTEALAQVGQTVKSKDQLGRFGLGLISPLNKCTSFTFTTLAKGRSHPVRWTFKRSSIEKMRDEIQIPMEKLAAMPRIPRPFGELAEDMGATWRTVVQLIGIKKDRMTTAVDLEDLEDNIRTQLGQAMYVKGVKVRLATLPSDSKDIIYRDVIPNTFTGEPLGIYETEWNSAGKVVFELFRAPRRGSSKPKGLVSVGELDSLTPISWKDFMAQARGFGLTGMKISELSDGFAALGSGYFEGTILCENVELAPERTRFMPSDALEELYFAIADWFENEGSFLYDQDRQLAQQERHQQLGLQSLERLHELLHQPEYSALREALRESVEWGRLGEGHVDPTKGDPDGDDDKPSKRVGQGGAGKNRKPGGDKSGGSDSPGGEDPDRPGDTPVGARGPRGQKRKLVGNDSTGLWLDYEPFELSMRLWEFDRSRGVLTFNIIHPLWQKLDDPDNPRRGKKNDRWVLHLQDWVILNVITLLTQPEEAFEQGREVVDRQAKPYVELFVTSSSRR